MVLLRQGSYVIGSYVQAHFDTTVNKGDFCLTGISYVCFSFWLFDMPQQLQSVIPKQNRDQDSDLVVIR